MLHDRERALSALNALDPGTNRETWVRIAMAAKAAGLTIDEFIEWSRPAPNFGTERECNSLWNSINDGAITAGTLYGLARSMGWNDPGRTRPTTNSAAKTERVNKHDIPLQENSQRISISSHISPLEFWEQCLEANAEHPYIVEKRGRPDGLRVVPENNEARIAGESISSWIVLPAFSLDGVLRTVQLIPPPGIGKKLNLPGAGFDDGVFIVGDIAQSSRAFIVEGIGQAWACWAATGNSSIVCFGAGRMASVANLLRKRYVNLPLIVVPDRGKESLGEAIAKQVCGFWVEFPNDKPANYDANDYAAEYGADVLAELLDKPKAPPMRFRMLGATDLLKAPPLRWLVRNVLPAEGLACLFGASGSGKSFLALDLCAAIAAGLEWFCYKVNPAPVVYVALEGEAGFSQRVKAWQTHHGSHLPDRLKFVMQSFDLRQCDDVEALGNAVIASGCAGGLLVIDTLNRAASGADENASTDMGRIIEAAKTLQTQLGGLVLLVHHSGKDASKGLRGHSSLNAALDASIEVQKLDNRREWRIDKSKDNADDAGLAFRLQVVEIGRDDDGEPITSCAVLPDYTTEQIRRVLPPKSGNQKIVWDSLGEFLRKAGDIRPASAPEGAPQNRPIASLEDAIQFIRERLACEPKRRTERAQQALEGLHAKGLIRIEAGFLWAT